MQDEGQQCGSAGRIGVLMYGGGHGPAPTHPRTDTGGVRPAPQPWGTLFVMGPAKGTWMPLTCPPSRGDGTLWCRVGHLGTVCDLQGVSGWGINAKWERRGIKTFLGGTSMKNIRNKG